MNPHKTFGQLAVRLALLYSSQKSIFRNQLIRVYADTMGARVSFLEINGDFPNIDKIVYLIEGLVLLT